MQLDRRENGAWARDRPLVPRTLRAALAGQPLPDWLLEATGLPDGATVVALRPELLGAVPDPLRRRIELLVNRLLDTHRAAVRDVPLVDWPWPRGVDACVVDWGERIGRLLRVCGLTDDRVILSEMTYGDLLALPGMGARSVYEIVVAAEVALDRAYAGIELPHDLVELRRRAASSSWAGLVSGEDARFSDLFGSHDRRLTDYLELAAGPACGRAREAELMLASMLPAVSERVAQIEQSPLEIAMRSYVEALSGLGGTRLEAVIRRVGLDGAAPRSFAAAADGLSISPERVRHLYVRLLGRIPSHPVYMPALDRALDLLTEAAPTSAAEAASSLQLSGISTIPFHPASVIAAARLCGRSVDLELDSHPTGEFVVRSLARMHTPWFIRMASRRASSFGAASLQELVSTAFATGNRLSTAEARHVVARYCNAEFLDDDWFWLPGRNRNRLCTITLRILWVGAALDLATIRAGICRAYPRRHAALIPPLPVLAAFYAAHPAFVVDTRGLVRPFVLLDHRKELGKNDRIFLDVLRSSRTGELDRASFRDACAARGMTSHTFYATTRLSAVLDKRPTGQWCLRGSPSVPSAPLQATS